MFTFVFLIVCCAVFYKYYLNKQYSSSPVYKGMILVKLGYYKTNEHINYFFNTHTIKSLVEKEFNTIKLTFPSKGFYIQVNVFDKNRDNIQNKILNVLDFIKKKEEKKFNIVYNSNITETSFSNSINKVSIIKKESIYNNYFIISSFFIALFISFLLSVVKDSIRGNDF